MVIQLNNSFDFVGFIKTIFMSLSRKKNSSLIFLHFEQPMFVSKSDSIENRFHSKTTEKYF